MYRFLLAAAPLLFMSVQVPTQASAASKDKVGQKCEPKKKKSGGMFGSIAGSIAGSALGRAGVPGSVAGIALPVSSLITDVIASKLNCKEQVQAANATTEATRGGVGTTSTWTSETRENVQGSSTVTAQNARSDGASCMTVTDVVIVEGEETTVDKQMCRSPGGGNYVVAA